MRPLRPAILGLVLAALQHQPAAPQSMRLPSLDSVHALGLDSISGAATSYFRPAHRARASELQVLLADFLRFAHDSVGVDVAMGVAVLDSSDWARVTTVPYGLPTNSGLGTGNLLLAASTPPERVGARVMPSGRAMDFLTIGHEGGHLLTWELLPPPMRAAVASRDSLPPEIMARFRKLRQIPAWYWEMVSNYFATAFLAAVHPEGAAAWYAHLQEVTAIPRPRFTHLDDWFGRVMTAVTSDSARYVFTAEGGLNQGWYQGVTGQVAVHLYEKAGTAFLNHIRAIFEVSAAPTTAELVVQLDALAPGVTDLLRRLGAGSEN
jgi:hypothetical protein